MAREITQTVYSFTELGKEVQTKVLNRFRDNEVFVESERWNSTFDWFIEKAKESGFIIDSHKDISFSGFYSQGDGASFTSDIDWDMFFTKDLQAVLYSCEVVRTSSHYVHGNTCSVRWEGCNNYTDAQAKIIEDIVETIEAKRLDLCKELYRNLENEYEWMRTDEYIKEAIECNDYEFYADGTTLKA